MNRANPEILHVANLVVQRPGEKAPFCITLPELRLCANQIVSLTGASGSGKSSLLEVLGLISKPTKLDAYSLRLGLDSQPMSELTESVLELKESVIAPIRADYIGFILQTGGLLPFLTVKDNIEFVRKLKGLVPEASFVETLVSELKITPLLNKFPHQLSIGERQRVAFIRSVAHQPMLVLADEPTAALDPYTADMLFELLKAITQELTLSVLLVSHDWQLLKKHHITGLSAKMLDSHTSEFVYE